MNFDKLKGFRDFLPKEMKARKEVFERIEKVVQKYGFRELDTPSLEPLELYRIKSGEELLEQTYSFEDKGGRNVTLIPEQTPTRARLVASKKSLNKPVKWYSTSKRWRYERPQKGRLREFYQTDIDIFGADTVEADAEILTVLVEIMDELEVLDSVNILVNDRRVMENILNHLKISESNYEEVLDIIDDKEKVTRDKFVKQLKELGIDSNIAKLIDKITEVSGTFNEALSEVNKLLETFNDVKVVKKEVTSRLNKLESVLESNGIEYQVVLDFSIVRGLEYYTGLVFEVFDKKGDLRAICGGGRYNNLVELFGGNSVSAIGFAIGDAVIEELMRREGVWPDETLNTDVYVLPVSSDVKEKTSEIASKLREEGLLVETDLKGRNVSSQLKYANSIGARKVLILGENDLEKGKITLKDMDSGEERLISLEDITDKIIEEL